MMEWRTTLTCSHFKVPQVHSENLIMYQIIHPTPSFDTIVIFIFDVVLGYFKMATCQSSTPPCRPALSWNVFRTIASLIFPRQFLG
jgi:hypothetical protein